MKLGKKLGIIVLAGNMLFCLAGSVFFMERMEKRCLETAVENYSGQMASVEYAFSEMVSDKQFDHMGELALEAYLKYQFRRCFGPGYAFIKDRECLVNLTDYEILAPSGYSGPYMLQPSKQGRVLLMKREFRRFPGFSVLLVRNIASYDRAVKEELGILLFMCAALLLGTEGAVFFLLRRTLRPLGLLTETARELGRGNLSARSGISGDDEPGALAEAFNQMAGQIESKVEELRFLLGALTHEIRTPVTGIIGYSQTLLHVKLTDEQREKALLQIAGSAQRLERLSGKILALLGSCEKDNIVMEWIPVRELFEAVRREAAHEAEKKQLQLLVEIEQTEAGQPSVWGDRALLEDLIFNLVHNSIKASHENGHIWMKAENKILYVRDKGIGIAQEHIPHLTEAFFMADHSRGRSEGGSGIGLALCDKIARFHRMEFRFESREGQGTSSELHCPDEIYKMFTT